MLGPGTHKNCLKRNPFLNFMLTNNTCSHLSGLAVFCDLNCSCLIFLLFLFHNPGANSVSNDKIDFVGEEKYVLLTCLHSWDSPPFPVFMIFAATIFLRFFFLCYQ